MTFGEVGEEVLVGTVTFGKEIYGKKSERAGIESSGRMDLPPEAETVGADDPAVGVAEEPPAEPEG